MTLPIAALTLAVLSQAPAPRLLAVDPARSTITYGIVHKLHKADGVSHEVEGKAALLADGKVQVMVRAPIASFKSGESSRDEHMQEALETSRYSHVTLKGVAQVSPPASFPSTQEIGLQAILELHGRKRPESIPLKLEWASPTEVRVKTSFAVSLDAYQVERPSLFFMKIDDACAISVDLVLKQEP